MNDKSETELFNKISPKLNSKPNTSQLQLSDKMNIEFYRFQAEINKK